MAADSPFQPPVRPAATRDGIVNGARSVMFAGFYGRVGAVLQGLPYIYTLYGRFTLIMFCCGVLWGRFRAVGGPGAAAAAHDAPGEPAVGSQRRPAEPSADRGRAAGRGKGRESGRWFALLGLLHAAICGVARGVGAFVGDSACRVAVQPGGERLGARLRAMRPPAPPPPSGADSFVGADGGAPAQAHCPHPWPRPHCRGGGESGKWGCWRAA